MTVYLPPLYAAALLAGVVVAFLIFAPVIRALRALAPKLSGLVCDGDVMSNTKTITMGTWLAATVLFIRVGWNAQPNDGSVLWLSAYVGLFVVNSVSNRVVAMKGAASAPTPPGGSP